MQIDGKLFTRLVYLLHTNKGLSIPEPIFKCLPGGNFIKVALQDGIGASDVNMDIYNSFLEEGSKSGPGDPKEGIIIIQKLVDSYLRSDTRMELPQRLKIYRMLENLRAMMSEQTVIFDLENPGDVKDIPKFDTGFQPLDSATGGFYQGIFLLMGPPGSGKTSLMVALLETLRQYDHNGSLLFLENEIPPAMMKGRLSNVFRRTKFKKGDKLICGPWNAHHILDWVKEHPDPDRVILFDGPDVVIGGDASQGSKAFIADEYLTLIELKSYCKTIIVSGWPNRKNNTVTHFNDVGDAIEKARYADCIIGINPMANSHSQLICLKNRFGPMGTDLNFEFNMETLVWKPGSLALEADFWSAIAAEQDAETDSQNHGEL